MSTIVSLPLSRLLLDGKNSRLHNDFEDQREIIEAILADPMWGPKTLKLAEDIATHGRSPADLLIVTPGDAPASSYTVLDGNRRLTAMRILQRPDLAAEVLPTKTMVQLREYAKTAPTINEVQAVVFAARDDADHWIELRHGGQLDGAGQLTWDSTATDRWRTRHQEAKSTVSQVLSFLERMHVMPEGYSESPGSFPRTTLNRLLLSKAALASYGFAVGKDGYLLLLNDPKSIANALAPVVADLWSGEITVSDLKREAQRRAYEKRAVKFPATKTMLATPVRADSVSESKEAAPKIGRTKRAAKAKARPTTRDRKALIPQTASLNVTDDRINDIYVELQTLDVNDFPNSVGVLFRVFLELSVDSFIGRQSPPLLTKAELEDHRGKGRLSGKIQAVIAHLTKSKIMTAKELIAAKELVTETTLFNSKVSLMHAFVHNGSVTPKPSELKTEWNDLSAFFHNLWPQDEGQP